MYFDININFQFLIFHCWYIKLQLILCILVIPGSSAGKETFCNVGDPGSIPRLGRSTGEEDKLPTLVSLCFPGGSAGKESTHNAGDLGLIPGLGRSPREGSSNPPQYSCLENPRDGGAWWATVYGMAQSWTRLSDLAAAAAAVP